MKGVYFLIGVLLFAACAYIFLAEHGKFYEFFDGTTDSSGTDASGNSVVTTTTGSGVVTPPMPGGTIPSANIVPSPTTTSTTSSTNNETVSVPPSASIGSGAPSTTTSATMPTVGTEPAPQGNLAPGSTTANPTTSTPSQQDFNVLQYAVNNFSSAVNAYSGGKAGVLGKLSPGDATYFNSLHAQIASLGPNADPSTSPYSAAQTAGKIVEFQKATQYITTQLVNDNNGNTTLQQTVAAAVLQAQPTSSNASSTGQPLIASTPNSLLSNLYGGAQGLFGQNASGTPGNQGQMPLTGQFTTNGSPTTLANPATGTTFAPGKKDAEMCDANDLDSLIVQVRTIVANLTSLNSSDPTIVARINNISSLLQDLQDMKTEIQQGKMDSSKIPVRVGDARNFLSQATIVQNQLPSLISMPGSAAKPTSSENPAAPQNLLQMAQYLRGSINLSFDGSLYAQEQMAKRVDNIIMLLKTKQISSADAQHILQTLSAIQNQCSPGGYDSSSNSVFSSSPQPMGPMPNSPRPGYMPDPSQLDAAANGGNDPTVRPGTNSDSYKTRASAAYSAYSSGDSSSADYKSKLQNLCAQVQKSGLDMGDVGCTNLQNVPPDFGYKGTYLQVCNRLKDTWGGGYPQMFGCPTN